MVPFRSDVILKNALQNVGQLIENDLFNEEKSNDIQMELVHKAKETFSQLHQDYLKKKTNQLTATKRVSISHNYAKQRATSVLILEAVDEQSRIEEERKKEKETKKIELEKKKKEKREERQEKEREKMKKKEEIK
jgi:hypothetical protein